MMGGKRDYDVGYGKPPMHTRFKPGASGNRAGRPKGSKSIRALLQAELDQKVPITEQGIAKKITKREVMVKTLVNKAMKGDAKAYKTIMDSCPPEEQPAAPDFRDGPVVIRLRLEEDDV